jgi:RNA polymerase sigma-70 factor, ECF subfamily
MGLNAEDISRLYAAHAEELLGYFARRTMQAETAVEMVGETFARAFAHRASFRGERELEELAWVYGIARALLADFFRRGRVQRAALARLGVQIPELVDADFDRIEELAGLEALRRRLGEELELLSGEHREALQLRILEERSYAEVARMLDVSEQVARARVSRALRRLRSQMSSMREETNNA